MSPTPEPATQPLLSCPGGPAEKIGLRPGGWQARCPDCGYEFYTLMDEPTLPPHQTRGDWITFGEHTTQRSDRRA